MNGGDGVRRTAKTGGLIAALASLLLMAMLAWAPAADATTIQRVVSAGGIEAWLVREPSIPIIAMNVAFHGGAALDPKDKLGLATMVSGLLDEGAGDLDSPAFQSRLDALAISMGFHADRDGFEASLKTLSANRAEAFRLFGLALQQPRFDAEPVERIRRQLTLRLERQREDPQAVASRALMASLFPGHPYGQPVDGTVAGLKAISRDDLQRFVRDRFGRDQMVIGVVGDISAAELSLLLDQTFGALPAQAAPFDIPPVTPKGTGVAQVIEKDIPQSVVAFAGPGLLRNDPDYYAGYVLNYILGGGGFASRLTDEVREKRGLAYSIFTVLMPLRHAGLLYGGVATRNARVAETIKLTREQIAKMRKNGVTDIELRNAKTYLNGSFPLQLSSNDRIAGILVSIQFEHLGIDYLDRRAGLINAVTLEDISRVAQRLLDPDHFGIVVVGKPAGLPRQ